jgi:hypothetical protein
VNKNCGFIFHQRIVAKVYQLASYFTMDTSLDSLEEALSVRRQIETLEKRLAALLGGSVSSDSTSGKGDGHMSAVYKSPQKKGGLTPAGRRKLSQLMKARWAAKRQATAKE